MISFEIVAYADDLPCVSEKLEPAQFQEKQKLLSVALQNVNKEGLLVLARTEFLISQLILGNSTSVKGKFYSPFTFLLDCMYRKIVV